MNNEDKCIKILHIVSGDLWAGAEIQICNLIKSIKECNNININIISLNYGILYDNIKNYNIDVKVYNEKELSNISIIYKILKYVYKMKPDLIHTHRYKENIIGVIASILIPKSKIIKTIHGKPEYVLKDKTLLGLLIYIMDKTLEYFFFDKIVYVSDELLQRLDKKDLKTNIIIENGIDIEETEYRAKIKLENVLEKNKNKKKIAIIGRLVQIKRIDIFIEIVKLLKNSELNVHGYIIGDGPLRNNVEKAIKDEGLEEMVCILGFVENPLPYLNEMNCLILTSDHEGLPTILLESLCLKIPVIAHDVGGISVVLENGKNGILVENQDSSIYVKEIKKILINDKLRNQITENGYKNVVKNYTSQQNAKAYLKLYEDLYNDRI